MGKKSRDKGGRGEREAMSYLQPVVDRVCEEMGRERLVLRRNQDQRWAKKQYDLIGVPWMCLEVKRQEDMSGIEGWWRQTLAACGHRQYPVLMYRPNYQKWKVRMKIHAAAGDQWSWLTVTIDIDTFLEWFESMLRYRMRS